VRGMLRTVRIIVRTVIAAALVLAFPSHASAQGLAPASPAHAGALPEEVLAEALFLLDALPPGGRDLNLSLVLAQGERDPVTGRAEITASPRVQFAMPFADGRLGFTVDVGIGTTGAVLEEPGASLKLLLRSPHADRTGLAVSLDLFGSTHSLAETEAGVGLNAIRPVGPVTLRAGAAFATGVRSWSPHVHAGVSGAFALGARWRALAEILADVSHREVAVAAGPALKVSIGESTALMAGALFQVTPAAGFPLFMVQLTQGL
jgi:hypothetical protein